MRSILTARRVTLTTTRTWLSLTCVGDQLVRLRAAWSRLARFDRSRHCNITVAMGVDRTYRGHHKIDAHYPFETSSKSDPAGLLSGYCAVSKICALRSSVRRTGSS